MSAAALCGRAGHHLHELLQDADGAAAGRAGGRHRLQAAELRGDGQAGDGVRRAEAAPAQRPRQALEGRCRGEGGGEFVGYLCRDGCCPFPRSYANCCSLDTIALWVSSVG